MARQRRIIIRGKQRPDIDPAQLVQVLLAIAADWERSGADGATSPDVHGSDVEDRQAGAVETAG
jgi:hypothetical protein